MKRFLIVFSTLLVGFMTGCSYDDSEVWNAIDKMQQEQEEMQEQLDAQQTLLNALANNLSIVSITEIEGGYEITFSDNSSITIMHGEDGFDGKDGADGDSFFGDVTWDNEFVYITLADGSVVVIPMAEVPTNKIWYTTSDNLPIVPYSSNGFGANIVSNTYENGRGVILFDGDVTKIGDCAFMQCHTLTSIYIPDSVTEIRDSGFYDCSALISITIPDSVTEIGYSAFNSCDNLTTVTLPNSLTTLSYHTFWMCSNLREITIPDSVTTLEDGVFGCCESLTSITIPESVTEIGCQAFWSCDSLVEVYCESSTPIEAKIMEEYFPVITEWFSFEYHNEDLKIYVPTESVDAYKGAWGWSDVADHIVGYDF